MSRKCERCQCDITVSHILKEDSFSEIRCSNCGRILEATLLSKILVLCYYIVGIFIVTLCPLSILYIVIVQFLWTMIAYFYLPAFLYLYKEKNEDSLE